MNTAQEFVREWRRERRRGHIHSFTTAADIRASCACGVRHTMTQNSLPRNPAYQNGSSCPYVDGDRSQSQIISFSRFYSLVFSVRSTFSCVKLCKKDPQELIRPNNPWIPLFPDSIDKIHFKMSFSFFAISGVFCLTVVQKRV